MVPVHTTCAGTPISVLTYALFPTLHTYKWALPACSAPDYFDLRLLKQNAASNELLRLSNVRRVVDGLLDYYDQACVVVRAFARACVGACLAHALRVGTQAAP